MQNKEPITVEEIELDEAIKRILNSSIQKKSKKMVIACPGAGKTRGLARLDLLKDTLDYLPLTTEVMLKAAELWAQARNQGTPTADPKALDCDVILAAQALSENGIVATENVGHLSLFVEAKDWREILPAS